MSTAILASKIRYNIYVTILISMLYVGYMTITTNTNNTINYKIIYLQFSSISVLHWIIEKLYLKSML